MNNPDEIDQLRALLEAKDAYWKNVCAKLMMEVKKSKNEVDRLKTRLAVEQDRSKVRGDSLLSATVRIDGFESYIKGLEVVVETASIVKENAVLIKDPRMSLQTDCYLVSLDDIESLRKALAALDEKKKP